MFALQRTEKGMCNGEKDFIFSINCIDFILSIVNCLIKILNIPLAFVLTGLNIKVLKWCRDKFYISIASYFISMKNITFTPTL